MLILSMIIVRNSSCGKVMFSQASVYLQGPCMAKGDVHGEGVGQTATAANGMQSYWSYLINIIRIC